MNKKVKSIVKKTAKIGAVVCVAAGAVAVMTSKTALQAVLEGRDYFKKTVKKIMEEEPAAEEISQVPAVKAQEEAVAEESDFEEGTV